VLSQDLAEHGNAERRVCSVGRTVPGIEDQVTVTFKLERLDGMPADPPSFKTTILVWQPGDPIHLGRRTLQVVRVRDDDPDQAPVLVVQDVAERASGAER
jgi:hypothetical protein